MRARALLLALLVANLALAGCLAARSDEKASSSSAQPGAAAWAERALPHGEGHDHRDASQHRGLSTPNFQVLGWDPLETAYHGRSSGSTFCGEARDTGERRLAFVHSFWSDVALVVADVTDPKRPVVVGELALPLTHVYDVAATPDARFVLLATSPLDEGPDQAPALPGVAQPSFRDACTGAWRPLRAAAGAETLAPYDSGVVLVDVADPSDPVVADYRPLPALGAHSVFATQMGDAAPLVLASVTNLAHQGSYFAFLTIQETPLGAKLALESVYRPAPADPNAVINGHMDGWVHEHPVTGRPLAYLADWDGGLHLVDVSDPKAPALVGRWSDATLRDGNNGGNVHGALPLETTWEGRHYTFVGQEVTGRPRDTPTGLVHVLDTTDPAAPARVGAWTLPVDVAWEEVLQFSTHYFRLHERTLFVAMYHGGVWAVDVEDPARPVARGVFVPDHVPPRPAGELDRDQYDWTPIVLDLHAFDDGTLVVWDGSSGVYTVRYNAKAGFPAPEPWPVPGL